MTFSKSKKTGSDIDKLRQDGRVEMIGQDAMN
jgi:hypothetical protein